MSVWSSTIAYIQDTMTDEELMGEIGNSPDPMLIQETIKDLSFVLDDDIMQVIRNLTLRQFREKREDLLGGRAEEC